ncbi:MAG: hypothetical protein E7606_03730 [Ruminococcaceae bacterium]|nr:hypothetical protein [Oscillospiraceae bacterium]
MEKKQAFGSCESCEFYDYDEYTDSYVCTVNIDQDDIERLRYGKSACPYYRFYDEYKSVHKQI